MFLEFDSPFWSEGEEVMKIARVEKGTKGKEENWSDSVLGFDEVINNRRALVCWIGGRAVEIMEKTDEKEVKRYWINFNFSYFKLFLLGALYPN